MDKMFQITSEQRTYRYKIDVQTYKQNGFPNNHNKITLSKNNK